MTLLSDVASKSPQCGRPHHGADTPTDLPRSASCALGHLTRVEARACPLFSSSCPSGGPWGKPATRAMGWARALRPCPVASCATRRGTTCGWFHQWRRAERLLLGLNLPQAVPRNLLLQRRAALVQQVLKVLFRGLHIVLR